jgi:RNA polymerase sigma-70 factor, ECF subfamily
MPRGAPPWRPIEIAGLAPGRRDQALPDPLHRAAHDDPSGATPPGPLAGPTDLTLLDRVRARDEAALAALYDRYGGLVFTVALRVLGDRDLAEEVMQDTFLRCWNGVETYRPERGHAAGWLMGIARNRAVDVLRSRQHQARLRERTTLPDGDDPGQPVVGDAAEAIATGQAVAAALRTLPPNQRHVVELAYYGGMTQAEIAQTLGEPLGTVKTRTRTALERLRTALRPLFATDIEIDPNRSENLPAERA